MNCPNCGHPASPKIKTSKVLPCESCGGTIFVADGAFTQAGEAGVMHDAPALLTLGGAARADGLTLRPVGVIRYSYGRGWWDEFWCLEGDGGVWVSVDEGDLVVERPSAKSDLPRLKPSVGPGDKFLIADTPYSVTEVETGECVAFRGELPEQVKLGERHRFVNLINAEGEALSYEHWDEGEAWYEGAWLDPYELTIERAE